MGSCMSCLKDISLEKEMTEYFSALKDTMLPLYLHLYMILKDKPEEKEMGGSIDIAKKAITDAQCQIEQHPKNIKNNRRIIHDMRNQISPVFGYLDLLLFDLTDQKWKKDIEQCIMQAREKLDLLGAFIRQDEATKLESLHD